MSYRVIIKRLVYSSYFHVTKTTDPGNIVDIVRNLILNCHIKFNFKEVRFYPNFKN